MEEITDLENPSADFLKGFNQGYLIAKEMPELADQLKALSSGSLQISGLKKGIDEYLKERIKDIMPDWLKRDRFISLDNNLDQSLDKDDFERE